MCGIVGIISWKRSAVGALERICKKMTAALSHRGNDGEGFFTSPTHEAFLGHRRLSIFDTSSAGNQPMTTQDGRFSIVFNGEIYNFKELKEELYLHNIQFKSSTDTEVLLYGFALFKEAIFLKLRGMFAGAIWDHEKKELLIFRDHLGIKPLFWWKDENNFVCASELKALREHPSISHELNPHAVNEYFQFGSIHPPRTIFKNIYSLSPGHFLRISQNEYSIHEYWSLNSIVTQETDASPETIKTMVKDQLRDSVTHHILSDIPVGAFLSGGLDSSTIVAYMKEQLTSKFDTFSLGFGAEGRGLDESGYAAKIASYFGTRHHHILCDGEFFVEDFNQFIQHLDQPSSDGFNSFLISQSTKNKVSVALSGLGGDELFLGYRYHRTIAQMQQLKKSFFSPAYSLLSRSAQKNNLIKRIVGKSALAGVEYFTDFASVDGYFAARKLPEKNDRLFVGKSYLHDQVDNTELVKSIFSQEKDLLNAYSKAELAWYTAGTLLPDGDVTGMAFTLEVRFPFLDIPLIEKMLALPSFYKLDAKNLRPKKLLYSILTDFIPESFFLQEKRGFEMPIGYWLRKHPEIYRPLLHQPYFNPIVMQNRVLAFEKNPINYLSIWAPLIFTEWLRQNKITV